MKIYMFMVYAVVGMGGGQMYVNNKCRFLTDRGWKVMIFSGLQGELVIHELESYPTYTFPELNIMPNVFKEKDKRKFVDTMVKCIGAETNDEIVIESSFSPGTYWGEILACRLRARHIVCFLDERPDLIIYEEYIPFFEFKLKRKELAGISKKSLPLLFRDKVIINEKNNSWLPMACTNVVEDYSNKTIEDVLKSIGNEKVFCCIGRLEKEYVFAAAEAFLKYVTTFNEKRYVLLFVGASDNVNEEQRIKNLFVGLKHVRLFMVGHIYPLPKVLFEHVDLVVASAGCASVAYAQNAKTISVDANDSKAIGVMGYTTQNSLYREEEEPQDICDLIIKVINTEYLQQFTYTPKVQFLVDELLTKHLNFLANTDQTLNYYPIQKMHLGYKDILRRMVSYIFGKKIYLCLELYYRKHKVKLVTK